MAGSFLTLVILILAITAPITLAQVAIGNCTTVGCYHGGQCDPSQVSYTTDGRYHDPCGDSMLVCKQNPGAGVQNGTCDWKGCANSDYIAGWNTKLAPFPARCPPSTSYCPDSSLTCQPLIPFGGACDESRDDECAGQDGMCLNQQCVTKSVAFNGSCGIERIEYLYNYKTSRTAITQTIERDNCTVGFYCSQDQLCIPARNLGDTCTQDRECTSTSCSSDGGTTLGQCIQPTDSYQQVKTYVYIVIGAAVAAFMITVLFGLWYLHRIQSRREHEEYNHFFEAQAQYQVNGEPAEGALYGIQHNSGSKIVVTTPKSQKRGSKAYVRSSSNTPTLTRSASSAFLDASSSKRQSSAPEEKYEDEVTSSSAYPFATQSTMRQTNGNETTLVRRPSDVIPGTGIRYGHREQLLFATKASYHSQPRH